MRTNVYICVIFTLLFVGCGGSTLPQPEVEPEEYIIPSTAVQTLLKCNASKGALAIQDIVSGEIAGIPENNITWLEERFVTSHGGAVTSLGKIYEGKNAVGLAWNEGRVVKVTGDDVGLRLSKTIQSLEGYLIDDVLRLVVGTNSGLVVVSGEKENGSFKLIKVESEIASLGEVTSIALSKMILISGWPEIPVVYFIAEGDLYFADIGTLEGNGGCVYKIYSSEANLRKDGTPKKAIKVVAENDHAAFYVKGEEIGDDGLYNSSAWIVDIYNKEAPLKDINLNVADLGEVIVSDIVLNSSNLYFASSVYKPEEKVLVNNGIAVFENLNFVPVLRNYLKVPKKHHDSFYQSKLDVDITTAYLRGGEVSAKVYSVVDDYLNQVWEFKTDIEKGASLATLVWNDVYNNKIQSSILHDLSIGIENIGIGYNNVEYQSPLLATDMIVGLNGNSVSFIDFENVIYDSMIEKMMLFDQYCLADKNSRVEASFGAEYSAVVVGVNGLQELRVFEVGSKELSGLGDSVGYSDLALAFQGFSGEALAKIRDVVIIQETDSLNQLIFLLVYGRYSNINFYRVAAYRFDIESGSVDFVSSTDFESPAASHHFINSSKVGRVAFVGGVQKEKSDYRVYVQTGIDDKNAYLASLRICKGKSKFCEAGGDLVKSIDPYAGHSVAFYKDSSISVSVNQNGIINIAPEDSLPHIYDQKSGKTIDAEIQRVDDRFVINSEDELGERYLVVIEYNWSSNNYEVIADCKNCKFSDIEAYESVLAATNKYGELLIYDLE